MNRRSLFALPLALPAMVAAAISSSPKPVGALTIRLDCKEVVDAIEACLAEAARAAEEAARTQLEAARAEINVAVESGWLTREEAATR